MVMIIWTFNHDPALSILTAVTYHITMEYVVKNAVAEVSSTGTVTSDIANLLSGNSGPGIKSSATKQEEAVAIQASIDASKETGFLTGTPQAVLTSGPVSTGAVASIPTEPSGVLDTATTMFAEGDGSGPQPYSPDGLSDLAPAPGN